MHGALYGLLRYNDLDVDRYSHVRGIFASTTPRTYRLEVPRISLCFI